jgi:glycogen operon protein
MHVDGFRFDLATALARDGGGFDAGSAFLDALRQDPVLASVKLIAEPWDMTAWETGRFPPGLAEWNDRFRDAARGFWLTRGTSAGELARRITASSDLFRHSGRVPQATINFLTAHDGFSLADLVAYQSKHNEANAQDNRDGTDDNRSVNCGVEGQTADAGVLALRARLQRALLATLMIAQGVPMLPAGDGEGRSQDGNNNAYCQDNPLSWIGWERADQSLAEFTRRLIALRRTYPAFRRTRWFDGSPTAAGDRDLMWLWRDGTEMTPGRWESAESCCFGFLIGRIDPHETALLVLINGGDAQIDFALPAAPGSAWSLLLDTATPDAAPRQFSMAAGVPARGLLVLASAGGSA